MLISFLYNVITFVSFEFFSRKDRNQGYLDMVQFTESESFMTLSTLCFLLRADDVELIFAFTVGKIRLKILKKVY